MHSRAEVIAMMNSPSNSLKYIAFFRKDGFERLWMGLGMLLGILALVYLPRPALSATWALNIVARLVVGIYFAVWAYRYLFLAFLGFHLAYLGFYLRLLDFQSSVGTVAFRKPSLRKIYFDDLEAYEKWLRDYVRNYRRIEQAEIKAERWAIRGAKFTRELEALLSRYPLEASERVEIFTKWEGLRNPEAKRKYLARLTGTLAHRYHVFIPLPITEPPSDVETEEEEVMDPAVELVHEESRAFRRQAELAKSPREKIRLMQKAIHIEERLSRSQAEAAAELVGTEAVRAPAATIRHLSLQAIARERFRLDGLVPSKADATMAREIMLALLDPGRSFSRFKAAYRAEDTLKKMVRRQYEVHLGRSFDPRTFASTLSWLEQEEILFSKPKTDERVYGLLSKTRGKSAAAQKIITALLDFDRSLRDL